MSRASAGFRRDVQRALSNQESCPRYQRIRSERPLWGRLAFRYICSHPFLFDHADIAVPADQGALSRLRRALWVGIPSALRDRIAPYRGRFFTDAPKQSFLTE